jgi:hypothetical protein
MEQLIGILVLLPVALSLVMVNLRIRKEYLYGTEYDVFRRNMFFGTQVRDVPEERNETK